MLSVLAPSRYEESEKNAFQIPPPPEVLVKRIARCGLARLLAALLPCVTLAVIASAQPLDTFTCVTCASRAEHGLVPSFRAGDYSSLPTLIIDPTCDCPFPNNVIPSSRLLQNGAWPEDIYRRNPRAFFGTEGRVARVVAQGITPLLEAFRYGSSRHPLRHLHPEELQRLLASLSPADVNARFRNSGGISGWTALHYAALRSWPGIIQQLLDSGAIVDAKADNGQTPLMRANTVESFRELQTAGADIRAQAENGFTVLHRAALSLDAASVEALIADGLDPNAEMSGGWTPLLYAGSRETFETLQAAGADIQTQLDSGFTVLHGAARNTDAATVEALIAAGLDPNAEASGGLTPLLYARSRETFETLLAGGAGLAPIEAVFAPDGLDAVRQEEVSSSVLRNAVEVVGRFASTSLVAQLRAINPSFAEVPDGVGSTPSFPLRYAASWNDDPAMIAALSTPNVTATTLMAGGFPLHQAARSNTNPAVVEAILAAGGNIHVNSPQYGASGPTPLYLAASNQNPRGAEIVSVLLEAGADANGMDMNGEDTGYAPLYAAAMMQNVAAVELLIAAGADVNITGSSDYQSLLADVLGRGRYDCGYLPVADALRAAGATSWRIVGEQRMPYVPGPPVAECETVSAKVQELIDSAADLDALDSQGFTCLHLSAADGKAVDITALAAAGANVNAATRGGRLTPLHVAIWKRAGLATVRALIAAGADVNATDWIEQTALHRAARDSRADPAVVEALLAAGADVNARDDNWRMPLDYATRVDVNNEPVAELLRAAGGTCRSCDAP